MLGGLEFKNDTLEAYNFGDGRVVFHDSVPTLRFQYRLHDHLGNTVVFFEDKNNNGCITTEGEATSQADLEIVQRLLYYPFGMALEGLGAWNAQPRLEAGGQAWQQYRYNGKERDTLTGWYDYGARWYLDGIGRFPSVDPLAGKMPGWSPYSYGFDNPVMFVDPDGNIPIPVITGLIGAAGGLIYGLASGKNWKETAALTLGGFVTGATLGLGGAGVVALGGVEAIGGAGVSYIMIGSGVAGGIAGNAVEQGVKVALGESSSIDGHEMAISGAFGMSEVVLGPAGTVAGDIAKNSIKESLKAAVKHPNRAQIRFAVKELSSQLRTNPGVSKAQSKIAAKKLIQAAQENRSATLKGVIRFSGKSVDVSVSALETSVTEETKAKILDKNDD